MRTAILLALWVSSAHAQAAMTPQLALARICASEESFQRITDGCAAIHRVLRRGAQRHRIGAALSTIAGSASIT